MTSDQTWHVAGATVYALNGRGGNLWSMNVREGFDDNDKRLSVDERMKVAALAASAPALLTELESAALALEEASKLLFAKGLQGCASIMAAHCDKTRAAIAASGV